MLLYLSDSPQKMGHNLVVTKAPNTTSDFQILTNLPGLSEQHLKKERTLLEKHRLDTVLELSS